MAVQAPKKKAAAPSSKANQFLQNFVAGADTTDLNEYADLIKGAKAGKRAYGAGRSKQPAGASANAQAQGFNAAVGNFAAGSPQAQAAAQGVAPQGAASGHTGGNQGKLTPVSSGPSDDDIERTKRIANVVGAETKLAADRTVAWAEGLPTPGGIMALVLILIFFIWAVVPVNNGLTRMQLLYLTLTGKTRIAGEQPMPTQGSTGKDGNQAAQGWWSWLGGMEQGVNAVINPISMFGVGGGGPITNNVGTPGMVTQMNPNNTGYVPDFGAGI